MNDAPAGSFLEEVRLGEEFIQDALSLAIEVQVVEGASNIERARLPYRSMRYQSYILRVKMYGVALISKTRLPLPEPWIVPLGMRRRSCFLTCTDKT